MNTMSVKFWGVRGSHPVPGESTLRFGGNTPCVEIQAGDQTLILDAGTGIVGLGRDLLKRCAGAPCRVNLFFSHMHHDHIQGFPFFSPAYSPTSELFIFGPDLQGRTLEQSLTELMAPPYFPVSIGELAAKKAFYSLADRQVVVLPGLDQPPVVYPGHELPSELPEDAIVVHILRSYGHPGGVYIYKIQWRGQTVVYASDTEGYVNVDRRLVDFCREADLLIHDSHYSEAHYLGLAPGFPSTQGYGHSTPRMATDVARAAEVKRLALFHFEPQYDEEMIASIEQEACLYFPQTCAAYEGLEILVGEPVETAIRPMRSRRLPVRERVTAPAVCGRL